MSGSSNAGMFTLDAFRNISFQPVSVVKIRFVNRFVVFLCMLFVALWFATITGLTGNVLYEIDSWFYEEVFVYHQYIVELGCLAIAGLCALFILKWLIKKLRYKLNADYIEGNFINSEIVPYKYEMIEKRPGMFVCHKKNGKTDYRDMLGEILR